MNTAAPRMFVCAWCVSPTAGRPVAPNLGGMDSSNKAEKHKRKSENIDEFLAPKSNADVKPLVTTPEAPVANKDFVATAHAKRQKTEDAAPGKVQPPCTDGVSKELFTACATVSSIMYKLDESRDGGTYEDIFEPVKVYAPLAGAPCVDTHGEFEATSPPFAYMVLEGNHQPRTLVLAWRGSTTLMDWVVDAGGNPVQSRRWSTALQGLKAHGGYSGLVESDFTKHEHAIAELIKDQERPIRRVLFTGHSLAGGMAQVAHVFVRGQVLQQAVPWDGITLGDGPGQVDMRSICFAAPMTVYEPSDSLAADASFRGLDANSFNVVFDCDVVPRLPGCLKYLDGLINDLMDPVVGQIKTTIPLYRIVRLWWDARKELQELYASASSSEKVKALLTVLTRFEHVGTVFYYPDGATQPLELRGDKADEELDVYNDRWHHDSRVKDAATDLLKAHLRYKTLSVRPGDEDWDKDY